MDVEPTIDKVEVVNLREWAGPGDASWFIGAHGAGHVGWYGPLADDAAQRVHDSVAHAAEGQPITDHNRLNRRLRDSVGLHPSRPTSWAIGAVDCAIWDLHGRLAQRSVASLLAAAPTSTVRLYASWLRLDLTSPSLSDTISGICDEGWLFTKWGLRRIPSCEPRSEAERLAHAAQIVIAAVDRKPAFDAVFTWDRPFASTFIDMVDLESVEWLEDPLPTHLLAEYRELPPAPLALGERLMIHQDAADLLRLRPRALAIDIVGCGGITRAVKLVASAASAGIPIAPHGRSLIPALHLAAAYPSVVTTPEYQLQWEPARQLLYAEPWQPTSGGMPLHDLPGLGITPRST